jgi:hypothetical protein
VNLDVAAPTRDKTMHHGQAHAGAFTDGLGGEERIEQLGLRLLVHAGPVVADRDLDAVIGVGERDVDRAAAFARIDRMLIGRGSRRRSAR